MTRDELIEAIAEYFHISDDLDSFEWVSGATIRGEDGEYRWMTLANIVEAVEDLLDYD